MAYVYDVRGPRARIGFLWFVAVLGLMAFGPLGFAPLYAAVAAVAAAQIARAWRFRRERVSMAVAAATAGCMPLAAAAGAGWVGAVVLAGVVASVVAGAALGEPGRKDKGKDKGAADPVVVAAVTPPAPSDAEVAKRLGAAAKAPPSPFGPGAMGAPVKPPAGTAGSSKPADDKDTSDKVEGGKDKGGKDKGATAKAKPARPSITWVTDPVAVLRSAGFTVQSFLFVGLAAASPVLAYRVEPGAAVALFILVSAYEAGDFLVGSGASNRIEGPLAGMLSIGVLAFTLAVLGVPPFDLRSAFAFAGFAAVLCPIGQMVGSLLLPSARTRALAVRRLDSLLVLGPVWVWAVTVYLGSLPPA